MKTAPGGAARRVVSPRAFRGREGGSVATTIGVVPLIGVVVHAGRLAVLMGFLAGLLQDHVCQADHAEDDEYDQYATPTHIGRTLGAAAAGGKREHGNDHGGHGGDVSLDDVHENPLSFSS
ncbi:MAG: hypothetical protein WBP22_01160 [Candidatus Saccharimonas sp.]